MITKLGYCAYKNHFLQDPGTITGNASVSGQWCAGFIGGSTGYLNTASTTALSTDYMIIWRMCSTIFFVFINSITFATIFNNLVDEYGYTGSVSAP